MDVDELLFELEHRGLHDGDAASALRDLLAERDQLKARVAELENVSGYLWAIEWMPTRSIPAEIEQPSPRDLAADGGESWARRTAERYPTEARLVRAPIGAWQVQP